LLQQAATIAAFVDMNDALTARIMTTGILKGNAQMLKLRLLNFIKSNEAARSLNAQPSIGKIVAPEMFRHSILGAIMKDQWDIKRLNEMQGRVGGILSTIIEGNHENEHEPEENNYLQQNEVSLLARTVVSASVLKKNSLKNGGVQFSTFTNEEKYKKRLQRRANSEAGAIFLKSNAIHEDIIYAQMKVVIVEPICFDELSNYNSL